MTYTKKKILPALHRSDKVSKPDLQQIGDQNYTDTILRYGNLAIKHPQLKTNAKTIVDAINELYYRPSGGTTVIPNPPLYAVSGISTESGSLILTEDGLYLTTESGEVTPVPTKGDLVAVEIQGQGDKDGIYTIITANPTESATESLTKIKFNDTVYSVAGGYTLPIASAETLGGIKVGAGFNINSETGVLTNTSIVSANVSESPSAQLNSLKVNNTVYSIPSGGGSYTAGDGIYFSNIITENFTTTAPASEYPYLSNTECHLTHTLKRIVSIECNPTTGEFFSHSYNPTTNTITVVCRDNVPEGTPIAITYVDTDIGNIINAEVGNLSTDLKHDMTKYEIRDNHVWDKSRNIQWISAGTVTDQYGTHTVYKTDLATYGAVAGESRCRIYVTGAQKIYVYVKQDYEGLDTNYAYVVIGDFDKELGYDGRWSGSAKIYKGETTPDYDAFSWNNTTFEGESHYFDVWYHKQENPNASQETAHKNARAYIYVVVTSEYSSGNGEIFNVYHDSGKPIANGNWSHAEGYGTWAGGNYAHAEGMGTLAGGEYYAHAEGYSCRAIGRQSAHAEGYMTEASGLESSHSEGYITVASGTNSHAEGYNTKATYNHAHSEGGSTLAGAKAAHAEGEATSATSYAAHSEGYRTKAFGGDGAHAEGSNTVAEGTTHAEGYSSKAKHSGAHAEGYYSEATNTAAHAEGNYTQATGYASHAEGNYSQATAQYSHAEGSNTVASDFYAHAEGNSTEASGGDGAHAEGNNTVASGSSAHAEGTHTQATGSGSHAGGGYSIASGQYSYAMGDNCTASGGYSHAEGQTTVASGDRSHSEGWNTTASAASAHAEGDSTTASSSYAHAEGQNSVASNAAAHAEGTNTTASGYASHAEGTHTQATGAGSHAEGYSDVEAEIVASGRGAHAEGFMTSAVGMASHAEGGGSKALGQESHAEGGGTVAYGNWSHTEGAGNTAYAYYSHVEGAGTKSFEVFTHVEGAGNNNIAQYAHLEGGGNSTTSSAHMSHTEGAGNTNYGHQSHIEGSGNRVSGEESHVEGAGNQVHGPKTHAEGGGNTAYTIGSHVEGKHNFIAGFGLHAEGSFNCIGSTTSVPQFSYGTTYAVGDIVGVNDNYAKHGNELTDPLLFRCTTAPGQIQAGTGIEIISADSWDSSTTYPANSVVKFTDGPTGYYRNSSEVSAGGNPPPANSSWQKISQILSPMVGRSGANTRFTYAYGNGQYTGWWLNGNDTAQTIVSVTVDGVATSATLEQGGRIIRLPFAPANGAYVIMEYYVVQAYEYSYYLLDVNSEIGYNNPIAKVQNIVSISPMWEAVATPKYAHIEGFYNIALGDYQHVGGKFNSADANKSLIIGNGEDGSHRSNALTLDWSGNLVISGDVTTGTTLSTSSQSLAAAINELYGIIPDVSVTQVLPSSGNTKVATITVDSTATDIYAPTPTEVAIDDTLSEGTKVATITIDGVDTEILVPSAGSSVQVTQIQESGTHIADIEVDGVTTELYAPNGGGAIIDDNDIALDKTWSSYKINEMFFELAQRVAAIERYLWGQPVLTEDGDNRVTEDGDERILEENEE